MEGINYRARNLVSVCVDAVDGREISGRLYTKYYENPVLFNGISELISDMERFFDEIRYPQASTEARSFRKQSGSESSPPERKEVVEVMSSKDVLAQKGNKGTFVVHIQYRQNATWQGNVVWAEKNITQSFRSALELLKLIDSSLDEMDEDLAK